MDIREEKRRIREMVWERLEREGVALFPRPIRGRIPNFRGAERAAILLTTQPEWRSARVLFVNPDSPQRYVRLLGLMQGKLVIMATPRLREGFLVLDPTRILPINYEKAATIKGAFKYGRKVGLDIPKVDLKVTGSVAVDERGGRLGKGHGYSDIEYGILGEIGAVSEGTPVATTVHELQIVERVPKEGHDMPVHLIVTPERVIRTRARGRPRLLWEMLREEIFDEIPLLSYLRERKDG